MSETLTWDGEALSGPIVCEDLSLLRAFATRGGNRVMPGAAGRRALAPVRDQIDVTLVWSVTGRFAPLTGTPHDDREVGLEENLEHYRALFTSAGDAEGEHAISLAFAGDSFTGGAQLRDYAQARTGPETARILTRLTIAAGELT